MNKSIILPISLIFVIVMLACEAPNHDGSSPYDERGPYTVEKLLNVGSGTIPNGTPAQYPKNIENDPTALTLYFPGNAKTGERFPLLTFGNGTFVVPSYYDELIEHVVSYGFVVIGANHSQVGSGKEMIKAAQWAISQAGTKGSPIYGIVDTDKVGAFGQSQGGTGTCNAGLDPLLDTIVPLSGVSPNVNYFANNLKIPVFFVNSAQEDNMNSSVLNVYNVYNSVKVPAVYGVMADGTNHNSYGDIEDNPGCGGIPNDAKESRGAVAAWFDWQLKGKPDLKSLFVGPDCAFCKSPNWKKIESKGF